MPPKNPAAAAAPRNRTLRLREDDRARLASQLEGDADLTAAMLAEQLEQRVFLADSLDLLRRFPAACVDLVFLDPPYNRDKNFGASTFRKLKEPSYEIWFEDVLSAVLPVLKPTASVYVCADWQCSSAVARVVDKHLHVLNRITWEREKGRGARHNWKNCSEDIWFCAASRNYFFDASAVKLRRRVRAPYRDDEGQPRDWQDDAGTPMRDTHPSNLWTDVSVPFWSMPENTEHPTQKSEKLLAKIILASSRPGDLVLDPFLGSGTSAVVAKKLGRRFVGIEQEQEYALLALRRLELAEQDASIQGYRDGVFWERNSRTAR